MTLALEQRISLQLRRFALLLVAWVLFAAASLLIPSSATAAKVDIGIDLSQQQMRVSVLGRPAYRWPVSTARPGYRTPTGTFRPIRLERSWYSTIYDYAPMPYSIFFYGGYAIHGTTETSRLGRPVSHGCVRLHPGNARTLFNLVRQYGSANTRITITR
jgi:lipoprotein-anchoring transpeptidase ErfK/SrfK